MFFAGGRIWILNLYWCDVSGVQYFEKYFSKHDSPHDPCRFRLHTGVLVAVHHRRTAMKARASTSALTTPTDPVPLSWVGRGCSLWSRVLGKDLRKRRSGIDWLTDQWTSGPKQRRCSSTDRPRSRYIIAKAGEKLKPA